MVPIPQTEYEIRARAETFTVAGSDRLLQILKDARVPTPLRGVAADCLGELGCDLVAEAALVEIAKNEPAVFLELLGDSLESQE